MSDVDEVDTDDVDDEEHYDDDVAPTAIAVLEYLAQAVVEDPDQVEIEIDERRNGSIELTVRVAPDDMGRVIGKRGRVANAIRTVVRAAAAKDDVEVDVEFLD